MRIKSMYAEAKEYETNASSRRNTAVSCIAIATNLNQCSSFLVLYSALRDPAIFDSQLLVDVINCIPIGWLEGYYIFTSGREAESEKLGKMDSENSKIRFAWDVNF